jgi:DNA-directed RNA polymerase specialized sigma24 family protein
MNRGMNPMMLTIEALIPGLRRYARRLKRDANTADHLTQGCLERAISRWSQRRDVGRTRSWIFAILHNLAMEFLRQQRRRAASHRRNRDQLQALFAPDRWSAMIPPNSSSELPLRLTVNSVRLRNSGAVRRVRRRGAANLQVLTR